MYQTSIEFFKPRFIRFWENCCLVAHDDCVKVLSFPSVFDENEVEISDSKKPLVLDIIYKPFGMVLDFKLSMSEEQLYLLDLNHNMEDEKNPKFSLFYFNTSRINTDPAVSVAPRQFRP